MVRYDPKPCVPYDELMIFPNDRGGAWGVRRFIGGSNESVPFVNAGLTNERISAIVSSVVGHKVPITARTSTEIEFPLTLSEVYRKRGTILVSIANECRDSTKTKGIIA